jgi:hypothetical protein
MTSHRNVKISHRWLEITKGARALTKILNAILKLITYFLFYKSNSSKLDRIFLQHLNHRKLKFVLGATPEVNNRKKQVVNE